MTNELLELLRIESNDLDKEFSKASIKGKGTPQEIADFREGYFNSIIRKYFPFPYRVTKGGIIDTFGNKSASIDCVLCNPAHPYTIDNSGKYSVLLADGIDAAIEIKPDIKSKHELIRGLSQIKSVKILRRSKSPIVVTSRVTEEIIEYSKTIPSFIYSIEAKKNIENTLNEVIEYYVQNDIPLEEQVDYIVIHNIGIFVNYKYQELNKGYVPEGIPRYGYFFETWNELTFAAFLLYLNLSFTAVPVITSSVLERYLYSIKPIKTGRFNCEVFWEKGHLTNASTL